MKIMFEEKDMIDFIKWYDEKSKMDCHLTFKEEFDEWISLQNTSHNTRLEGYKKLADEFYPYHKARSLWSTPSLAFKVKYEELSIKGDEQNTAAKIDNLNPDKYGFEFYLKNGE